MEHIRRQTAPITLIVIAIVVGLMFLIAAPDSAQAIKTYKQTGEALAPYDVGEYKVVKNKKYGKVKVSSFEANPVFNTTWHVYSTMKGNKKATLQTFAYLPVSYDRSGDMGNPQSINVTPSGEYVYIVYPIKKGSTTCRIVRYNLKKIASLGIDSENMDQLVRAAHNHFTGRANDQLQNELMSCVTFGPWIKNFGHGAAVAYNPKDKCLWFTSATGKATTNLQRINMNTLKPDLKIVFKLKSTVKMGNNLAFDKKGRCYFWSYSGGGWAPKGSIKIYQGKIPKSHKVKFKLIMQGIRNPISTNIQSMGYNSKSNRLYLVSNQAIMSVPVSKLGKLKNKDVKVSVFTGKREYEGISFDQQGTGYLLVNKYSELLKVSPGF
jgi:hypothetical protein